MLLPGLSVIALLGGGGLVAPRPALSVPSAALISPPDATRLEWLDASERARRFQYDLHVPEGWRVDRDPNRHPGVMLLHGKATCGVHPVALRPNETLQTFHPVFSALHSAELLQHGMAKEVLNHQTILLANGLAAIEQEVALHEGGMSLELYVVTAEEGSILICETEANLWPSYRTTFQRILRSFVLKR